MFLQRFVNSARKCLARKRYLAFLVLLISSTVFYCTIFHLNVICFRGNLEKKISTICDKFNRNEFSGSLCNEICSHRSTFHCPENASKNRKFAFVIGNEGTKKITVKEAPDSVDPLKWLDRDGHQRFPSEVEFIRMVNRTVFFKYNASLTLPELREFLNLRIHFGDTEIFHRFMDDAWRLVNDNDYMVAKIWDGRELFPKIYGSCGPFFGEEYISAFEGSNHLEIMSATDWKHRIQKAVLILDFVEELDSNFITLCDIKLTNFGISDNRLKYMNLEHVFAAPFMDRYLSDAKTCWKDVQCSFKACRSKCSKNIEKCTNRQMNNNLQIACDKIFRGSTYSPGLLVTSRSTKILLNLLDQCADPQNNIEADPYRPLGPSKEIRNAIYMELTNIYDSLTFIN
ncbi:divergent protein kinase domain 1C [Lutzomyia longipalpis]|uniref:divergent protein kinase domain 1C n=1 Tax=Lutzomyia longipalpis TaxID=7200 RepID=UPI0024841FFF|nr:divergent protein kinase domain 1C [Lutzomyia longipalpis]